MAAKTRLFEVYDKLPEKELSQKISMVETAGHGRQHGQAWNLVNKISGRKSQSQAK